MISCKIDMNWWEKFTNMWQLTFFHWLMASWWRNMSDIFYIINIPEILYYHVITLTSSFFLNNRSVVLENNRYFLCGCIGLFLLLFTKPATSLRRNFDHSFTSQRRKILRRCDVVLWMSYECNISTYLQRRCNETTTRLRRRSDVADSPCAHWAVWEDPL